MKAALPVPENVFNKIFTTFSDVEENPRPRPAIAFIHFLEPFPASWPPITPPPAGAGICPGRTHYRSSLAIEASGGCLQHPAPLCIKAIFLPENPTPRWFHPFLGQTSSGIRLASLIP
jgi:hypothetical protein